MTSWNKLLIEENIDVRNVKRCHALVRRKGWEEEKNEGRKDRIDISENEFIDCRSIIYRSQNNNNNNNDDDKRNRNGQL
jgi:hypothetical protein